MIPKTPASQDGYLLGLDLGGTRLKALAITPEGKELLRQTAPTDGPDWQEKVFTCVEKIIRQLGDPLATGVAAPGLASRDESHIAFMPGRLAGLEGLNWTTFLHSESPVPVLNDAHAALIGEVWIGAARDETDVILLTLGTGVGGAIFSHGRLLRGHLGRAGHFGHITLDADGPPDIVRTPGSLEDAVGNHSLVRRSGGKFSCTADLLNAAVADDAEAIALWQNLVRDLAVGIVSLINVLDPSLVLVGGGIAEAGDKLLLPLSAELDRYEWRPGGAKVHLARTQLGDWSGAYGAAAHAKSIF